MKIGKVLSLLVMSQFFILGCSPKAPERSEVAEGPPLADAPSETEHRQADNPRPVPPTVSTAEPTAAPLNLTLPKSVNDRQAAEDWSQFSESEASNRFAPKEKDEQKLKFNAKLRMKEDATLESTRSNYRDSVDGAEMGVEYRTR